MPPQAARFDRVVEVQLRDVGAEHPFLSSDPTHTLNVSETGLLIVVPSRLDACLGQEILVTLVWDGGRFETPAEIVRFESPYWKDPSKSVMGVRLFTQLPHTLLIPV